MDEIVSIEPYGFCINEGLPGIDVREIRTGISYINLSYLKLLKNKK